MKRGRVIKPKNKASKLDLRSDMRPHNASAIREMGRKIALRNRAGLPHSTTVMLSADLFYGRIMRRRTSIRKISMLVLRSVCSPQNHFAVV